MTVQSGVAHISNNLNGQLKQQVSEFSCYFVAVNEIADLKATAQIFYFY
jgi:hypothetical protein